MPPSATPVAHPAGFGATQRKDAWWLGPLGTILGLTIGFGYLTWAAFQGNNYEWGSYLSPAYSPPWFNKLPWLPAWFSPAFLILWAPGGFRATCYYYRKAYYRAAFASPPACSVNGYCPADYKGEKFFPLVLQNLHRYFLYLALVFVVILWWDVAESMFWATPEGGHEFKLGLGTFVMANGAFWIGAYTLSCHSLRHVIGGRRNLFRGPVGKLAYKAWRFVTSLNERHMALAWISLAGVCLSDLYVRLLASGVLADDFWFIR